MQPMDQCSCSREEELPHSAPLPHTCNTTNCNAVHDGQSILLHFSLRNLGSVWGLAVAVGYDHLIDTGLSFLPTSSSIRCLMRDWDTSRDERIMRHRVCLGFGVIAVMASNVKSQRPHKQADLSRCGFIAVEGLDSPPGYP